MFNDLTIKAATEGGKKGLKVSGYILVSAALAGIASALGSQDLRDSLSQHPQLVASIPVGMLIINVLISIVEKFIKVRSEGGEN